MKNDMNMSKRTLWKMIPGRYYEMLRYKLIMSMRPEDLIW